MYKRAQKGIGYLPQEACVFRKMSVEDNIMSVMEIAGIPKDVRNSRLESLIDEFNLSKVRKSLGIQLSGGERRRCEIARALAIDPKFILLDEPFAGVDPIAVEDIQYIIASSSTRTSGVIIHDQQCGRDTPQTDRPIFSTKGSILQQGILGSLPVMRRWYKYSVQDSFSRKSSPWNVPSRSCRMVAQSSSAE